MTKKLVKHICKPKLTPGERLIWAAAYALEFQRWTIGSTPVHLVEIKAARAALAQATLAVLSARAAVAYLDHGRICEQPMRPEVQVCARQILHPKSFLGVTVKKAKRQSSQTATTSRTPDNQDWKVRFESLLEGKSKKEAVAEAKKQPPPMPKFRVSPSRPKRIS